MNTPHTPGPWHVEHPYGEEGTYISSPDTTLVAKVYNERDAKLLAAAEEMLEQLTQLAASFTYWMPRYGDPGAVDSQLMQNVRAAIAKATA
jgi:hypothetical protein